MRTRVASSDWCASRKVVSVTATSVLLPQPAGELLRPDLEQQLPGAVRGRDPQVHLRQLGGRVDAHRRGAVRLVDRDVGQVAEQLAAAVAGAPGLDELRVGLDERRRDPPGREVGVGEDGLQERDVGGDAADAELRDRAPRLLDRLVERAAAAGQLGEHRVEVRGHLGAGVGRAAVEPDAAAAGGAVRRDHAGVGTEVVGRVLGGDPALQRRAAQSGCRPGTGRGRPASRRPRSASATAPGRRR